MAANLEAKRIPEKRLPPKRIHWGQALLGGYSGLIYVFLYLPIIILVVFSFNASRLNAVWTGFTFKWYGQLFQNGDILQSAKNSLIIAAFSTAFSTVIGTMTALVMHRRRFGGKALLEGILYIPVIIPEIVMGISLLALFALFKVPLGLVTMTIAHIAFSISFVVITVRARLDGFDLALEEAAQDLGANEWQTFRLITFPIIMPGILAGALMAFTLSIDDFIVSYFVAGPGSTTLPLRIYSMLKFGVTPEVNALSTIILMSTLTLIVAHERSKGRSADGSAGKISLDRL